MDSHSVALMGSAATKDPNAGTQSLLLTCSMAKTPRSFVERLTSWLVDAFDYDSAVVLFYDTAGTVVASHTLRTREDWLQDSLNVRKTGDRATLERAERDAAPVHDEGGGR